MTDTAQDACFAATRALCNVCGRLTDAKVVFRGGREHGAIEPQARGRRIRGGRVVLVKWCPDHGPTEALVSSDVAWYLRSLWYVKPGTEPLARAVGSQGGCPGPSCGLCPEHLQHTCVPILEITDRCNLACPVCLVPREGARGDLSLEQIGTIVDALLRYEGRINMLTISGGEPTLHGRFLEVVDAVRRPEVGVVSVSTNGLRLANEPGLARELAERGVVVSLQLDGSRPETSTTLRGRDDLAEAKRRAIDAVLAAGGRLSLTMTLARGVNEEEVGELLQRLFHCDQVVSVMVQPVAHTGWAASRLAHDPMDVLTIPDVVRLLASSSGGVLEEADFTPLPCSHPSCFALTYLLRTNDGRLVPLPRVVPPDDYIDIIKNQALLNTCADTLRRVKDALYGLWSQSGVTPDRDAILGSVKRILKDLDKLPRDASHRDVLDVGVANVKSIFVHHFMDRYTFDVSRAVKCCNHYPKTDGRLLPACVRNVGLAS